MLTVTVWVMLHATPSLSEGAFPHVRLVADEQPRRAYQDMTRLELQHEYDQLEAKRPGVWLPILLAAGGGIGAIILGALFWASFSTPYGIAVYGATLMIAAFVVALGIVAVSVVMFVRSKPDRDAIGRELDDIERHYREGRCRNVEGMRPCEKDPHGAPLPAPPVPKEPAVRPDYVPQVEVPGPRPSWVVASF